MGTATELEHAGHRHNLGPWALSHIAGDYECDVDIDAAVDSDMGNYRNLLFLVTQQLLALRARPITNSPSGLWSRQLRSHGRN
jgi:hypothetical protein